MNRVEINSNPHVVIGIVVMGYCRLMLAIMHSNLMFLFYLVIRNFLAWCLYEVVVVAVVAAVLIVTAVALAVGWISQLQPSRWMLQVQ